MTIKTLAAPPLLKVLLTMVPAIFIGCAKVAVEGGDKPIRIVMDINVKIDRDLDQFFAFEQAGSHSTTHPSTRPTSASAAQ